MCPDCGSIALTGESYDYGTCPETGYQDAGEGFRCLDCGASGPADDVLQYEPREPRIAPQSERAAARRKEVA